MDNINTSDVFVAATLVTLGFDPIGSDDQSGIRTWHFAPDAVKVVKAFQAGTLEVNALQFSAAVRSLRDELRRRAGRHA